MKKKIIIYSLIAVVVIILGLAMFSPKTPKQTFETMTVTAKELRQIVSVTGNVKSAAEVSLAFETGGKLANLLIDVNSPVKQGQLLAMLSNSDVVAQVNQARASLESSEAQLMQYQAALESQQAKLSEYKKGTRAEEIQLAQTNVYTAQKALSDAQINLQNVQNKAQTDLNNYYDDVKDILNDAYIKATDAVNNQTDALFENDKTTSPKLTFLVSDSQTQIDAENYRYLSTLALDAMKVKLDYLGTEQSHGDEAMTFFSEKLNIVLTCLNKAEIALNNAVGTSQTTLATYKGYVMTGRTNVNAALSSVNTQQQYLVSQKATNSSSIASAQASVNAALNSLQSYQDQLALKKAGYTAEQIASQEALVKQAQANVKSQEAQIKYNQANVDAALAALNKTQIYSPIDGVVTDTKYKKGEIVAMNSAVIIVMSLAKYQIEADVAEVDIANIKLADEASVTLDAYSSDVVFNAKVIKINPAQTIIDSVPTYKVTFEFAENSDKIKPGMTANVDILTALKQGALSVPSRAVLKKNSHRYIRVLNADNISYSEVTVTLGMRAQNGEVEILDGVKEGDKIIVSIK
jgi:RND family efflux transporter MFP subunit